MLQALLKILNVYAPNTWQNGVTDMKATWLNKQEQGCQDLHTEIDAHSPVGMVMTWTTATPPDGWLLCNGASLSTTTYAVLYAKIGVTYGGGGGNFNVPDMRGLFPRVNDDGRGLDSGRALGTYQADKNKNHQHGYTDTYVNNAANDSGASDQYLVGNGYSANTQNCTAAGGSEGRPLNLALYYIIKYE